MPSLKLDATRLDRAGEAIYRKRKGQAAVDVPWAEIKRQARYSSEAFNDMQSCIDLARIVLEAYADRQDGRWVR